MFAWAKLPGVSVHWPVEILQREDDKVTVFCKSDNAVFKVKPNCVTHMDGEDVDFAAKGIELLKKRKKMGTLSCFLEDWEWVKEELRDEGNGGERENNGIKDSENTFKNTDQRMKATGIGAVKDHTSKDNKIEDWDNIVKDMVTTLQDTDHQMEDTYNTIENSNIENLGTMEDLDLNTIEGFGSDMIVGLDKIEDIYKLIENSDNNTKNTDNTIEDNNIEGQKNKTKDMDKIMDLQKMNNTFRDTAHGSEDTAITINAVENAEDNIKDTIKDNKIKDPSNEIEDVDNTTEDINNIMDLDTNKLEDTGSRIKDTYKKVENTDNVELTVNENKLEDSDNKMEESDENIEDTSNTVDDSEYVPDSGVDDSTDSEVYPDFSHLRTLQSTEMRSSKCADLGEAEKRNLFLNMDGDNDTETEDDADVDESEVLRATDNPNIYIRRVSKNPRKKSNHKRKGKRVYNSYHACLLCKKLVQHIPKHAKTHKDASVVRAILDKAESEETEADFSDMRVKGDDAHNTDVLKMKKGELLLSRRPTTEFSSSEYGPCPSCREWILLSGIQRHQKTCRNTKSGVKTNMSKKSLILQADILAGRIQLEPSDCMMKEVFPIMKRDEVYLVARNDTLILLLGESWLKRNQDNKEKRKYYASQRMRAMARLLIEARKRGDAEISMWDLLQPSHFDAVADAALQVALPFIEDEEDLESPSNAIKAKYDVEKMVNIKWAHIMKNSLDEKGAKECKVFLKLMAVEWREKVTKLARTVLEKRKLTRSTELPSPEDIHKLTQHITNELKELSLEPENFHRVAVLAQTRLLCYNKRRSGEVEAIQVKSYLSRKTSVDDVDEGMMRQLSEVEKYLLTSQELMTVRGKRGRGVPVLVPPELKQVLKFLSDPKERESAGIVQSNMYLFPNSALGSLRAYESLKSIRSECQLISGENITSTKLRKYTATLTQVMNLQGYQVQWLCDHLGHTKRVHLQHYRQMSGFIERVEIAKLLLIQDNNLQKKFSGKKLEEIDVKDLVFGKEDAEGDRVTELSAEESMDEEDDECRPRKKAKASTRVRWTEEEEEEIRKFLGKFLDSKKTPRRQHCQKAMQKSRENGGVLQFRHWHKIVKKVSAMNRKK